MMNVAVRDTSTIEPASPQETEDERALDQLEDIIWSQRTRIRHDPDLAARLGSRLSDCVVMLGTHTLRQEQTGRLSLRTSRLMDVPPERMGELSSDLRRVAGKRSANDCPNSAVALLLSGWFGAFAIAEFGDEPVRRAARQLRNDYELFFDRLLNSAATC